MPIARALLAAASLAPRFLGVVKDASSGSSLSLTTLNLLPGDLIVAWSIIDGRNYVTPTTPSGWTAAVKATIDTNATTLVVYRIAGETPPTSVTLKSLDMVGCMMAAAWRGISGSSPLLTSAYSANSHDPPSLTAAEPALSVGIVVQSGSNVLSAPTSPPSQWTWIDNVRNASPPYPAATAAAYRHVSAPGAVDPGAFTGGSINGDVADAAIHLLFRLA
ncbi:MAG: hypothetical protein MUC79_13445 [Thiobacillaceae bacterium]|jgi:hypothetical protein|nr:hypothetical protein [Thiobacillaceae bacterium]